MRLKDASFTVFDVETTGLFPYSGDKICEIGALRVSPDGCTSTYETLVDPERPLSPEASAINGITADMLRGQPAIDDVLPEFLDFIKGSVLVAYNAPFDLGFIECALGDEAVSLKDFKVIDALRLARLLYPGLSRYNLTSVANSLHIFPDVEHRSMPDVLTTWGVFELELKELENRGVVTVSEISHPVMVSKAALAGDDTVAAIIRKAMRTGKSVCIKYRSIWEERITQRVITPMSIHEGFDSPYVVAFCHMRRARRNFHLKGILEACIEEKPEKRV